MSLSGSIIVASSPPTDHRNHPSVGASDVAARSGTARYLCLGRTR